jgi:hypothetical protein
MLPFNDRIKKVKLRKHNYSVLLIPLSVCVIACASPQYQRAPVPGFAIERIDENKKADLSEEAFANAILFDTPEEIEVFLRAGHSPDRMTYWGAIPWHDTNPLWVVCRNYDKAELFIRYGADVTRRPYIAAIFVRPIISERYPSESFQDYNPRHEKDVYKVIKLFLEAGADPNFRGAPGAPILLIPTEASYRSYFERHGRLPINNAIKYSAFSIVDLLLQYGAILDDKSLDYAKEATELSGFTDMEEYIKFLREKQQEE